jgi:hypothetical protein
MTWLGMFFALIAVLVGAALVLGLAIGRAFAIGAQGPELGGPLRESPAA